MPIYEYQCRDCEHYLDALQKIGEPALSTCPACGKESLKRLLSAPRFRLKGGGWYETDFKTGDKRNLAGDGAAKGSGSTAAKPDGSDKPAASKKADKDAKPKPGSGTAKSPD